jgi:Holliday junction resolvasome RuvABC endonuclease subunit
MTLKRTEILALDLGTKLGYYVGGDKKAHTKVFKAPGRMGELFKFLLEIEKEFKIKHIVYEKAAFQQGHAIPIYHGFVGVVKAFCETGGITHSCIPVGTLKKEFTGKGNAGKQMMMSKAEKLGMKFDDDNGADAFALYHVFLKQGGLK